MNWFRTQKKNTVCEIKSDSNCKKDRQRNLIPAKTGFLILCLAGFYTIVFSVSYAALGDSGTRSYYLSLIQDINACIVVPGIIFFQAPSIRRKYSKHCQSLQKIKKIEKTVYDSMTA